MAGMLNWMPPLPPRSRLMRRVPPWTRRLRSGLVSCTVRSRLTDLRQSGVSHLPSSPELLAERPSSERFQFKVMCRGQNVLCLRVSLPKPLAPPRGGLRSHTRLVPSITPSQSNPWENTQGHHLLKTECYLWCSKCGFRPPRRGQWSTWCWK